jgi:hypothetical protein
VVLGDDVGARNERTNRCGKKNAHTTQKARNG